IRAQNLEEFYDLAKAFQFLPLPKNNRLAILTLSGGEGVMATDACEMNGLQLANFTNETYEILKQLFPPWEIELNPFDLGVCMEFHMGELSLALDGLFAIAKDENVDVIAIQMPPHGFMSMFTGPDISEAISGPLKSQIDFFLESFREIGKPLIFWSSSQEVEELKLINILENFAIPIFLSSEKAMKAMAALYKFKLQTNAN
ncbi:hypothetical protein KKI24_00295, partial [bacterium]|nr:hypothetical protein [bacterium]